METVFRHGGAALRAGPAMKFPVETSSRQSAPGVVLYLTKDGYSSSCAAKMAGIRRYCAPRGWSAELVFRPDFPAEELAGILGRRPAGCIVDGVANDVDLPPRLFRDIPVAYIGYMRGRTGNRPNFHFNTAAIAETAFRELSASRPPCYAAIESPWPMRWSRQRARAFRDFARAKGADCFLFSSPADSGGDPGDGFVAYLAPWLAKLPEHCAVFAVSDHTAVLVARAASLAARPIPFSLTLVSVDNFAELCESAEPTISSVQLDFERAGFLAARAVGEIAACGVSRPAAHAPPGGPILIDPLLVVRRKSTSGRGRHEKFVLDAIATIRREACEGLTAAALIGRYPVSKRLFTMRFREATGHSVLDEIQHVRLEKACALLARTDIAVGAVPALCGFRCDRTLDALFRTRFHMSMSDWRKRNAW